MITVIGLQELYGKEARYCSNRKEVKDMAPMRATCWAASCTTATA